MQTRYECQLTPPDSGDEIILSGALFQPDQPDPQRPKKLIIMLHGWGADGADLASLAPQFAAVLPNMSFFFPDAPFPCSANPFGREWFALNTPDIRSDEITENCHAAGWILHQMISCCCNDLAYHANEIWIGGFSQGGMMSCASGLSYPEQLGGIFCLSGGLLGIPDNKQSKDTPILLVHGDSDMVVPLELYQHTAEKLGHAGFHPSCHLVHGLGHGIDATALTHLVEFLR